MRNLKFGTRSMFYKEHLHFIDINVPPIFYINMQIQLRIPGFYPLKLFLNLENPNFIQSVIHQSNIANTYILSHVFWEIGTTILISSLIVCQL